MKGSVREVRESRSAIPAMRYNLDDLLVLWQKLGG
jgi:hypothetical protein